MIQSLRRQVNIYGAIAAMVRRVFGVQRLVWMQFVVQILSMMIFVYFWRAVYVGASTLGGLDLQQTIN